MITVLKEFRVTLPNKPGELAKLTTLLGKQGINIHTIAGLAFSAPRATVCFVVKDDRKAAAVLKEGQFKFTVNPVFTVRMADKPGALARVAKKLAKNKINIEGIYLVNRTPKRVELAIAVDKPKAAEKVL
jgi:hypothetical protein